MKLCDRCAKYRPLNPAEAVSSVRIVSDAELRTFNLCAACFDDYKAHELAFFGGL